VTIGLLNASAEDTLLCVNCRRYAVVKQYYILRKAQEKHKECYKSKCHDILIQSDILYYYLLIYGNSKMGNISSNIYLDAISSISAARSKIIYHIILYGI